MTRAEGFQSVLGEFYAERWITAHVSERSESWSTSAERLRSMLSQIFRFAVRNLRADNDPAHAVKGAVTVPDTKHHPTLKLKDLPVFLQKIATYPGRLETHLGMRLLLITFVRKTELAKARWSEIDLEAAEWRIPAARMKKGEEHIVRLSTQAIGIFEQLRSLSHGFELVFPNWAGVRTRSSGSLRTPSAARCGRLITVLNIGKSGGR